MAAPVAKESKAEKGFTPPTFANHGKGTSDLFKKKFDDKKDFKHVLQAKTKTASGLIFTSGGDFDSKNNVTGNLKLNYKKDWFGEFEGSVSTAGPAKAELKLKKLVKGLTVTLTGDTAPAFAKPGGKPAKFTHSTVKVGADYSQEFFTGSASAETQFWKPTLLTGAAVIGFDGLSVGGEVKLDTDTITKDVDDYNVAAEYTQEDWTATLKTATQGSVLTAQYLHKVVPKKVSVAGEFTTPLDGSDEGRALGVAGEWNVDAATTLKARASTAKTFALALQHDLKNPDVRVGVASSWDIVGFSAWNPKAFGLSFTLGDYAAE